MIASSQYFLIFGRVNFNIVTLEDLTSSIVAAGVQELIN